MNAVACGYCGGFAPLVGGQVIYPHRPDLHAKRFYRCGPCDAYVGVHTGTKTPLGRLANRELRQAKMAAHAAFDPLWQNGAGNRSKRYAWLARALNVKPQECHIGMFDVAMCRRVVEVCTASKTG